MITHIVYKKYNSFLVNTYNQKLYLKILRFPIKMIHLATTIPILMIITQ